MKKRKKEKHIVKKITTIATMLLLFSCYSIYSYAQEIKAVSAFVYEEELYIYIRGISDIGADSQIQIGNVVCDNDNISAAGNTAIRTIILVDNSKSIPKASYGTINEIINTVIESAPESEQFKIGTVAEQITYLTEYSSDKEALKAAAGEIVYNDQDTYLSDILYETVEAVRKENTNMYTRLLVIADGADNKTIGYTYDEVVKFLSTQGVPVYTAGIVGKNNAKELETMFSFSRASNAESFLMDENMTVEQLAQALAMDEQNVCIKIKPDISVMDGSTKSILLKLNTPEGQVNITTTAVMPFGVLEEIQEEPQTVEEKTEEKTLPVIGEKETEPEPVKKTVPLQWILILLIPAAVIAAVIVIIVVKKTKNRKNNQPAVENVPAMQEKPFAALLSPPKAYIILKCNDLPEQIYKAPINEVIYIGRKETDIIIDDHYVSSRHCEIILRGELLYVKDCNSSNGTFYENIRIYEETPIISGGNLKIGQYTYNVRLEMNRSIPK